jgi:hypothetical protein
VQKYVDGAIGTSAQMRDGFGKRGIGSTRDGEGACKAGGGRIGSYAERRSGSTTRSISFARFISVERKS